MRPSRDQGEWVAAPGCLEFKGDLPEDFTLTIPDVSVGDQQVAESRMLRQAIESKGQSRSALAGVAPDDLAHSGQGKQ
jgi:hypothetical protein